MQVDDSRYWREQLVQIAKTLQRKTDPPRWTARAQNVVERDIAIAFFLIRKLHEHQKLSSLAHYTDVHILTYPLIATESLDAENSSAANSSHEIQDHLLPAGRVSFLNKNRFLSYYDFEHSNVERCHFVDLADRFIHGYASIVTRDSTRNWDNVYLVADRRRNSCAWRVSISDIAGVFSAVAKDYPSKLVCFLGPKETNEKKELQRDYYVISWNCKRHRDRLCQISRLIQNCTLDRETAVQIISTRCSCSQGLVRRLYRHLLNWIPAPDNAE